MCEKPQLPRREYACVCEAAKLVESGTSLEVAVEAMLRQYHFEDGDRERITREVVERLPETVRPMSVIERYQSYMQSDLWRMTARKRIEIDGYRCRMCGESKNLEVHHITYARLCMESMHDLVTLCQACHRRLHEKDANI